MSVSVVVVVFALAAATLARPDQLFIDDNEAYMHPRTRSTRSILTSDFNNGQLEQEKEASFWNSKAQEILQAKLLQKPNTNVAKNVIMFLGDGMSIPTLKAARIYWGQMYNESGEDRELSFEKFPYVGLSKTYCVDKQVPDSACTATAYLCGVKNNEATIGVTAKVKHNDCAASLLEENRITSIGRWSQLKNKRTGIITTTRVTHASPAGVFVHTANRDWEGSAPNECQDIAYQLVHGDTGRNFNVILGGGRAQFRPKSYKDEEGAFGGRNDDVNLINDWLQSKSGENAEYVWNREGLLNVSESVDYLLGLFESSHCKYHLDADPILDPTLEEMTEAAIKILSKAENGYFLFIEGGRIDHAHHDNQAKKALDETVEFSKAIQKAYDITNKEDTLIVVTADHAHVMSVNGYPDRGNDIFTIAGKGSDNIPYLTLSYANGPGYRPNADGRRYDVTNVNTRDKNYAFPAQVPLSSETHGGDDVGIFSTGPWAHLLSGTIEQNVIPHIMAFASCVGQGVTACDENIIHEK